jgi:hypothetical protein
MHSAGENAGSAAAPAAVWGKGRLRPALARTRASEISTKPSRNPHDLPINFSGRWQFAI